MVICRAGNPEFQRHDGNSRRDAVRTATAWFALFKEFQAETVTPFGPFVRPSDPMFGSAPQENHPPIPQISLQGLTTLHVSVITKDSITHAGFGHDPNGKSPDHSIPMPLGSITKTFNGQLLADSIQRGEVAATDPVEKHLPGRRPWRSWPPTGAVSRAS